MKKYGFTLVELLISLTIIGILSTLIVRVYQTMTSIWVKVEHEKIIQTELLFAMQTVQNLVDTHTIVIWSGWSNAQSMVLSGVWGITKLSLVWDACDRPLWSGALDGECNLQLQTHDGQTINLFNSQKVTLRNSIFKIIPDKLFTLEDETRDEIATQYRHNGFRRFGTIAVRTYNTRSRAFKVSTPFQTFFNSRL